MGEHSEGKPLNSAFAQSDIAHGNVAADTAEHAHFSHSDIGLEPILKPDKYASETSEHAHLSHSDTGLQPILQSDNACMTLGNYNRHGFRTFDQFEHNVLDPGSSDQTRRFSMMDTVSISDDEYTVHDDVSVMNKGYSFLSVGQYGHSRLPAGQLDHDYPLLKNSDNVDLAVDLLDRSYVPFLKFRPGFLTVSTDLRTEEL